MASSLRALLDSRYQNVVFKEDGVADVQVNTADIETRLAAMHRALVAHAALNQLLELSGAERCDKLIDAINEAIRRELITHREANWLKHFNTSANEAKHNLDASIGV